MKQFEFKLPTRIRFGPGIAAQLGKMLKDMGYGRVFISTGSYLVTTPVIDTVKASLEDAGLPYVVYSELKPDPTIEQVDAAAEALRNSGADVVLAVGGGSTIDNSKAMCMLQTHEGSIRDYLFGGSKTVVRPAMPLIVVPTTAGSGSEVTASAVITDVQNEIKLSVTHENLIPRLAVIDPLLHTGMSPFVTATTGMTP
jgi:alcohol dehydrogenase